MRTFFFLISCILILALLATGCGPKQPQIIDPAQCRFLFTQGERFKIYEFDKRKTFLHDGTLVDTRRSQEVRYETLAASPVAGGFFKVSFGEFIIVKYENKVITGNAEATASKGITLFKDDPGITKEALANALKEVFYVRIDNRGFLIAKGQGPPPNNPIAITDWKNVPGFQVPGPDAPLLRIAALGWIAPDGLIKKQSTWTDYQNIVLERSASNVEAKLSYRTDGATMDIFQVVAYGELTGKKQGAPIEVRNGRYFGQAIFNHTAGFFQTLKYETHVEYKNAAGRFFKETHLYTASNSKSKGFAPK